MVDRTALLARNFAALAVLALGITACRRSENVNRPAGDTAVAVAVGTPAAGTSGAAPAVDTARLTPDHRFLRMMSDHHQGLIEMAHYEAEDRKSPGVLADARRLDRVQDAELDTMVTMLEKTYRDPYTPSVMPANRAMLDTLRQAKGAAFDSTFLRMVVAHHREAIAMIDSALPSLADAKVRAMAKRMRADQTKEIAEFERRLRRH